MTYGENEIGGIADGDATIVNSSRRCAGCVNKGYDCTEESRKLGEHHDTWIVNGSPSTIPMALRHARSQFKWLVTNRENVSRQPENTIARLTLAVQLCNDATTDIQRTNAVILEELRRQGPEQPQVTAVATMQEDGYGCVISVGIAQKPTPTTSLSPWPSKRMAPSQRLKPGFSMGRDGVRRPGGGSQGGRGRPKHTSELVPQHAASRASGVESRLQDTFRTRIYL
ncbi:hypothetical protein CEP54_001844 [Fusarium duplospermum]|uniref:Uncharacterized protein n=1 Tax=Fusarium duplospermum TaxID=1325734 RepID=A0A428QYH2_9HYPO|nr:hypothetical protein CEP54_001844 [Fusarium duplospermum]